MKKLVSKKSIEELLKTHHKISSNSTWVLRTKEIANGGWKIEAEDVWGRRLAMSGNDPIELEAKIEEEIRTFLDIGGMV